MEIELDIARQYKLGPVIFAKLISPGFRNDYWNFLQSV